MQRQLCCWAKHSASPGTDLSSPPGCSSAALACMHKMPLFWCASQIIHISLYKKLPKEQQVLNLSFKLGFGEVLFGHQSQSLPWVLMFGKQQFWGLISWTERLSSGSFWDSSAGCWGLCWHLLATGINTSAEREAAMGYFKLLSSPRSGDWWQLLQPIWLSLVNTANWTANCSQLLSYAHSICFERRLHPQIRKGVENNYWNESDD